MTPVEIGKGRSFKGLANYLLRHDDRSRDAALSERVGWAQSFNLNDADPDRAWRLMAATAMSAEALKRAAGIRKGKPTEKPVWHYSLNFNPKDGTTAALQRKAVESSLRAMGLQDYQALAVMHRDKDHHHVHVMVNLISPETGVSAASKQPDGRPSMLSNSKTKLSKWAMAFEREHGLTVTEGRIANQTRRANGEKPENTKRLSRLAYEQRQAEGDDRRTAWMRCQQDDRRMMIAKDQEAMRERQQTEWAALKESYRLEKETRFRSQPRFKAVAAQIKAEFKPAWTELFRQQREELKRFEAGERGAAWLTLAFRTMVDVTREQGAMAGIVAALSRRGRQDTVTKRHRAEADRLSRTVRDQIEAALDRQKRQGALASRDARAEFLKQCAALKKTHDEQRKAMRGRWRDYNANRREQMEKARTPVRMQERGLSQRLSMGRRLEP